jgi:ethanolamine utilization protein EutA (predicted chaperonin)
MSTRKTQIQVAVIAACGAVLAAVIGARLWIFGTKSDSPRTVQYTGRVMDNENRKLENAKVIIEEDQTVQVQTTDSDGYFKVSLNPGTQTIHIRVEKDNYQRFDRIVSLTRTGVEPIQLTPMDLKFLSPSPTAVDEKAANNKKRNSQSKRIDKRHDASVNALLNNNR